YPMKRKSPFHSVRRNFDESGFFKLRVLFGVLLCFAGITLVFVVLGKASTQPRKPLNSVSKIAPWVIDHTANGQHAEFFVILADQGDLSGAASLPTKVEKRRFVHQTLLAKAQRTQEPILEWLRERNVEHRSFYIVNTILIKGDRLLAETLAARPD